MNVELTRRSSQLVDTGWLFERLGDSDIRIVDIRGEIKSASEPPPWYVAHEDAYKEAHIPGAVFVDWVEDIVDPEADIKVSLPRPHMFASLMSQLGIDNLHHVVIYDDCGGKLAARLWWLFKYFGHREVSLLNGGWSKWISEHKRSSTTPPNHSPTTYNLNVSSHLRAMLPEVESSLGAEGVCLMDCRGQALFDGEVTRGSRKGHIPGAINIPASSLVEGPHGTWKSEDDLLQIFEDAGITDDKRVITYCNAGVSASAGFFALTLLGYTNIANFDGSWYEWERDEQRPAEVTS
ncbi:MAG TPA: sulfurtransferase [Myxococcales bacterium]|nr:sulfurtransferase [Deltaproteobacteria bacterium]MBU47377.1 sulfurtransferase [Deltaproteobacteria bacterium]HAA56207.1 sulfurtransferase [Myxococcales bacterium]|tara:strand:+ start:24072 stop:24950 length:879 start_codon:yes stop_codon:yes gene_type:complete